MQKIWTLAALTLIGAWMEVGLGMAASLSNPTQTVSGGGVAVKVSYLNPRGDDGPRFLVALETHSVALDGYDLKNLARLSDGQGRDQAPSAVENKGGGHHREVFLTFPRVSPEAKSIELVVKDIAGVKERRFRWDLK